MVQFHLWLPFSWAWWGVDWTKVVRGSHKTCHVLICTSCDATRLAISLQSYGPHLRVPQDSGRLLGWVKIPVTYVSSCKSSQTFFLALAFYVLSNLIQGSIQDSCPVLGSSDWWPLHRRIEYRLFLHEVETDLALCRVRIPTVPRSCPVGFDR